MTISIILVKSEHGLWNDWYYVCYYFSRSVEPVLGFSVINLLSS